MSDLPPTLDQRPFDLALVKRTLGYTKTAIFARNTLWVLTIVRSIQLPLLAWGIGAIINGPIASKDTAHLMTAVAAYAAFIVFTEVVFCFRIRMALIFGEQVVSQMRRDVYARLLQMPMSFFHENKLGAIISRMTSDIEAIRAGVQDALFVSVVQLGQMVVAAILMAYYDPVLFLIVLAVGPIIWKINANFKDQQSRMLRAAQESYSRLTSSVAEAVGGIRVTQGFSRQTENAGIFRSLVADHSRYNIGASRNSAFFIPLLELNAQFFTGALLVAGGWRALNHSGGMSLGDLIMFMFLAGLFFSPFRIMGNQFNVAMTAMAGAERVFKMLDTPPAWSDPDDALSPPQIFGEVEFRDVTFGYDPKKPVLHGISFRASPGEVIALVGHTGSGKSSIINLVAKFYLPQGGEVLIDGNPTHRLASDALHRQTGIVTQHNFLFTGTLLENLQVARPDATPEHIEEVAKRLGILQEIRELGLNTVVSEQGAGISLGQRQLVCIVRAMLADPRILILDEATSAVDSLTELKIQRALEALMRGRTSFVIAHRLSTVRQADNVLVLDHGHIIERGTHASLIAAGGSYATMYEQFLGESS